MHVCKVQRIRKVKIRGLNFQTLTTFQLHNVRIYFQLVNHSITSDYYIEHLSTFIKSVIEL